MKFTCSVIVEKPLQVVADYFANPDYLKEYQEVYKKKELISGETGKKDAISTIWYGEGKREMILTETIIKNDLPHEFIGHYHHKNMDNTMRSVFSEIDGQKTKYDAEVHYTAFRGFIVKMMVLFFPSVFKKQVQKWLNNFKTFVESQ